MAVKLMTTLRGRLLLLILLAVAPTIAIEVYSQVVLRGTRQAEIRQEAVRLMRLVAAEQGRIDESARQLLIGFSEGQEIRSQDWARCSEAARLLTIVHHRLRLLAFPMRTNAARTLLSVLICCVAGAESRSFPLPVILIGGLAPVNR